jgi:hypothetical protein
VYKTCKAALGEFQELSRELSSLHTILHELEDEAKIPTSLLNRRGSDRKPELDKLLTNLSTTLKQIEDIVERYHSLGRDQKKTWDRVKFATKDLAELRSKVQSHINGINLFISSLSATSLARIEGLLDELVRDIKAGRKEPSIVSTDEDNDEVAWDELERELVGDGITREDVKQHKEVIRDYLRRLIEENIGDFDPSDSFSLENNPDYSRHSNHDPAPPEQNPSNSSHSTPISDLNTTVYTRTTIARGQLLEVENFTLAERQNLVSMVTKPYGGSGRSTSVRTEIARAQTIVNQLAFGTEKFNYKAYGKLGHATTPTRTLHVTGVFRTSKPSANMMALVASVNFALNALKPEHIYDYIEVPSGFRCTRRALVGFPVFFIMIVKLPLVRRYGIIFQDLSGGPLDAPFFKKRVLDAMESGEGSGI